MPEYDEWVGHDACPKSTCESENVTLEDDEVARCEDCGNRWYHDEWYTTTEVRVTLTEDADEEPETST